MNLTLFLAGALSILLGIIHSVLGERLIFQPLGNESGNSHIHKYRGILWATWHLATLFGGCLGLYLLELAGVSLPGTLTVYVSLTMFLGALLVFIGTKRRHPGWIILLLIAVLVLIAG